MNPDQPSREQIETRLTALLLGELPADEAALLRYTLSQDPALQKLHDELKATLALVREVEKKPADGLANEAGPLKLAAERRQKLLAHFKTPRPKTTRDPLFWLKRIEAPSLVTVLVAVALIAVVAAMLLPSLASAKRKSQHVSALSMARLNSLAALMQAADNVSAPAPSPSAPAPAATPLAKDLQSRMWSADNDTYPIQSRIQPNDTGAYPFEVITNSVVEGSPQVVTLAPAPPVAPPPAMPPVQIALPAAETGPEVVAQTAGTSEAERITVYKLGENAGVMNSAFSPSALTPALTPPLATVNAQPAQQTWIVPSSATESSSGSASVAGGGGFGGGGGTAGNYGFSRPGAPTQPQLPRVVAAPPGASGVLNDLSANRSYAQSAADKNNHQLAMGRTFTTREAKKAEATPPPAAATASPAAALADNFQTGAPREQSVQVITVPRPTEAPKAEVENATAHRNLILAERQYVLQKDQAKIQYKEGAVSGLVPSDGLATTIAAPPAAKVPNLDQTDLPLRKPAANTPSPQPEIMTVSNAFSTFAMNVSDVSFKFAEASLQNGRLPDTASIRGEEFLNAFDYRDPEAAPGQPLAFMSERARSPFAHNRDLLRFSVKAAAAGRSAGRALNLVLLLDTSGSMERADRVAIIREALRVLAAQLQPQDTVSVVTFARTARLWADGIHGDQAGATFAKIGGITPEGGTNLEEAMRLAYETARRHYLAGGLNRVVLLTDGAANLGNVEPGALQAQVEAQRKQGIALDCFGIGWEDFNDDLLEALSSHGDGRYAFLNSPEDAARDFATKLAGALQVAAADLKVQVEFNSQRVIAYRQIGYARHQLTKEQFRDNSVAAGEIAAQEAGNALYTVEVNPRGEGPIATVYVRYRVPGTQDYREHSWEVPYTGTAPALAQASPAMRLAAAASAFSEWLAASPYAQEVTPDELLKILNGVPAVYGADDRPKQLETMIREAKSLEGK